MRIVAQKPPTDHDCGPKCGGVGGSEVIQTLDRGLLAE